MGPKTEVLSYADGPLPLSDKVRALADGVLILKTYSEVIEQKAHHEAATLLA